MPRAKAIFREKVKQDYRCLLKQSVGLFRLVLDKNGKIIVN